MWWIVINCKLNGMFVGSMFHLESSVECNINQACLIVKTGHSRWDLHTHDFGLTLLLLKIIANFTLTLVG